MWNIKENKLVAEFEHDRMVRSVAVIDRNRIVSGSFDGKVRVWDLDKKEMIAEFDDAGSIVSVAVIDENRIVLGLVDSLRVWYVGDSVLNFIKKYVENNLKKDIHYQTKDDNFVLTSSGFANLVCKVIKRK